MFIVLPVYGRVIVIVLPVYGRVFLILEKMLIGYADESTLMVVVPSPGVSVVESPIRDQGGVSELSYLWGIKFNESMTKTMIVSRSRTMHPESPALTIGGIVLTDLIYN